MKADFLFRYTILDVLGYIGVAAYFALLTYYTHSTPGKMLMRLEVVTDKEEWTFLNILYRETIGRFLSSLLCIGYIAVGVQEKKQGFHDMLCDTYVVYRNMTYCEKKTQDVSPAAEETEEQTGESIPSAFELTQSHPIDTGAMPAAEPASVEPKPDHSYDGLNPDSSNLYQDNDITE